MDPQTSATEMVALARALVAQGDEGRALDPDDAERLAELTLALVEWLARGGFAPDWTRALNQ